MNKITLTSLADTLHELISTGPANCMKIDLIKLAESFRRCLYVYYKMSANKERLDFEISDGRVSFHATVTVKKQNYYLTLKKI